MNYFLNLGSQKFRSRKAIRAGLLAFLLRLAGVLAFGGLFAGAGLAQTNVTTH